MLCAIHQPNFLPHLGFFNKYRQCDVFILYDTAQYSKNNWHNRNRIQSAHGVRWLTVPVSVRLGHRIHEVQIAKAGFRQHHLALLQHAYGKAPYFKDTMAVLSKIYQETAHHLRLVDFNVAILQELFHWIDGRKKVLLASQLDVEPTLKGNATLVELCRCVGAKHYLSGPGARSYLDERQFARQGIAVHWQDYVQPPYAQVHASFIPHLSVVDALFNVGLAHVWGLV